MEVAELREWSRPAALAGERALPVLPALAGLLPGGLRLGATVAVAGPCATSLALALLAGPSRAGSWSAVVGLPDLGPAAAAEAGVDLGRLALVPHPGERWATVVAALVDAMDVVVLGPGVGVGPADARRLAARARRGGAVLVAAGLPWPEGCDLDLSATTLAWDGLGPGHGHLGGRLVEVASGGRRGAARRRTARVWLPSATGPAAPAEGPGLSAPDGPPGAAAAPGRVTVRLVTTAG